MQVEQPEHAKAGWNGAQFYTLELSLIRRYLHTARLDNDLARRYDLLISYYMALSARMKRHDRSKNKKEKLSMEYNHETFYQEATNLYRQYQDAISKHKKRFNVEILIMFDKWERELRRDEDALGLLMMDADDAMNALV